MMAQDSRSFALPAFRLRSFAMGIYDRDYQRGGNYYDRQPGFYLGGARTLTTNLVIVMFGIYVVQLITRDQQPRPDGWFTDFFSLHADVLKRPWLVFEFLTYGFLHDPRNFAHIIFNMIGLWFFGRVVESRYGRQEFLAFFLAAVIFSGLVWTAGEVLVHGITSTPILGASGGIAAVLILFCLNFPHQMIYIWGVIPVPAWLCAILFIGADILGATGHHTMQGGNVAYTAHLGGALFGFLYFQWGWRLERWMPSGELLARLKPSPKLRVHDPEDAEETERQVDEILKKIQEQGRASLTRRERRLLEEASREYQKKRR
jgi:membrane associated rhomboid family serine protease